MKSKKSKIKYDIIDESNEKTLLYTATIFTNINMDTGSTGFNFFVGLKVRGIENLKGLEKGIIFASNHANALDPILLPASLPFLSKFMPMFYTSRENTFYKRLWMRIFFSSGLFFKAWGSYAVAIGVHNYEESLRDHIKILNDKHSLFIFPEGGTTKDRNFKEAKGGVAFLAHKTNFPVVPVGINSTYKISWENFF